MTDTVIPFATSLVMTYSNYNITLHGSDLLSLSKVRPGNQTNQFNSPASSTNTIYVSKLVSVDGKVFCFLFT